MGVGEFLAPGKLVGALPSIGGRARVLRELINDVARGATYGVQFNVRGAVDRVCSPFDSVQSRPCTPGR
jgi:hypothetical protein